jgi:hypothetical protein
MTKFRRAIDLFPVGTMAFLLFFLAAPQRAYGQLSTDERLSRDGFWPTEQDLAPDEFASAAACFSCHQGVWATQKLTVMANGAGRAEDSGILHSHAEMSFSVGRFHYEIRTDAKGSRYIVTDGQQTSTYPLIWTFGTGRVGQSYLFKKEDGEFYEARVSYFDALHNLDFTPGRAVYAPKDLEEAMARKVRPSEAAKCFSCHDTAPVLNGVLDEKNLMPGIGCQACHGPGAKHVSAMRAASFADIADPGPATIFNPASLSPADSIDFCGACHSTFKDAKRSGRTGVANVRSQPYRLQSSKCAVKPDARLTCIACHDPHQPVERESATYDRVCLSCHLDPVNKKTSADHPGAACPVGKTNCSSCHMPRVFVPEMHADFTDHHIRIVKAGEPYPE